jgi:Tol biopolymer transport system component
VSYRDGVATVNLSGRFAAPDEGLSGKLRVGQVVWTVTRLLQTAQVRILVDGKPVGQVGPDHFNPADLSGGLLQPTVPALAALWPQRSSASNSPQVLFVRKGEVYAVPPEPNQQPNVVPLQTPGAKSAPTWSPNHQWIAFLLTSGGVESLLVGQPGKGQAAPIGALGSWLSPPSWSPDSRRVYVLAHQAGDVRLLVADLLDWSVQEGNLPRLPDDLQPASLAVSPDGAFVLAVGVHPGADPSAGGELFLGTLGPQGVIGWFPRQIAPGLGEVSSPVWVDPFTVAFIAQTDVKDDLNKLWVMKSDGWNPVAVVNVDPGNGPAIDLGKQVAVDPAGANFVFTVRSENGTSLWIVDRQGSNLRALTTPIPNDFASDPSFASH